MKCHSNANCFQDHINVRSIGDYQQANDISGVGSGNGQEMFNGKKNVSIFFRIQEFSDVLWKRDISLAYNAAEVDTSSAWTEWRFEKWWGNFGEEWRETRGSQHDGKRLLFYAGSWIEWET